MPIVRLFWPEIWIEIWVEGHEFRLARLGIFAKRDELDGFAGIAGFGEADGAHRTHDLEVRSGDRFSHLFSLDGHIAVRGGLLDRLGEG